MLRFALRKRLLVGAVRRSRVHALGPVGAGAVSANLVVSQVYGGGGKPCAYTPTTTSRSSTAARARSRWTGCRCSTPARPARGSSNAAALTELSGSLAPGQYLLVQEASNARRHAAPDIVDATPITMAAGAGKVALVTGQTSLGCNGPDQPCDAAALARIVDLVGYGNANFSEGSPAPAISATLSDFRGEGGCVDTDNNSLDFVAATPNARNTASALRDCSGDAAPFIAATTPADNATGVALDSNVTITFSEPVNVTGAWFAITTTRNRPRSAAAPRPSRSTRPRTSRPRRRAGSSSPVSGLGSGHRDPPNTVVGNPSWSFLTASPPPTVAIHTIQARPTPPCSACPSRPTSSRRSARTASTCRIPIPMPILDLGGAPRLHVVGTDGERGRFRARVRARHEFRGGHVEREPDHHRDHGPTIAVLSTGNPLPAATVLGIRRTDLPTAVIDDDSFGAFDPANDGIDFFETVEGMRVQVNNPVVVGPRNSNGEVWTLADTAPVHRCARTAAAS